MNVYKYRKRIQIPETYTHTGNVYNFEQVFEQFCKLVFELVFEQGCKQVCKLFGFSNVLRPNQFLNRFVNRLVNRFQGVGVGVFLFPLKTGQSHYGSNV